MHWNGEKQPHKGILRAKVLIFQGANPIFDVGSLSYTNEEIDSWSDLGKPYKIYQHKEYDPATNSMNISKDGNRS